MLLKRGSTFKDIVHALLRCLGEQEREACIEFFRTLLPHTKEKVVKTSTERLDSAGRTDDTPEECERDEDLTLLPAFASTSLRTPW